MKRWTIEPMKVISSCRGGSWLPSWMKAGKLLEILSLCEKWLSALPSSFLPFFSAHTLFPDLSFFFLKHPQQVFHQLSQMIEVPNQALVGNIAFKHYPSIDAVIHAPDPESGGYISLS